MIYVFIMINLFFCSLGLLIQKYLRRWKVNKKFIFVSWQSKKNKLLYFIGLKVGNSGPIFYLNLPYDSGSQTTYLINQAQNEAFMCHFDIYKRVVRMSWGSRDFLKQFWWFSRKKSLRTPPLWHYERLQFCYLLKFV